MLSNFQPSGEMPNPDVVLNPEEDVCPNTSVVEISDEESDEDCAIVSIDHSLEGESKWRNPHGMSPEHIKLTFTT